MTNPYEYQVQPQPGAQWNQPPPQQYPYGQQFYGQFYGQQFPSQQFYGQPGPTPGSRRPSAATTIITAISGILLAGAAGYLEVDALLGLRRGLFELPLLSITILFGYAISIPLLLAGSLCAFLRKTAGAILLIIGTALLLTSWLINALRTGLLDYFKMLFEYFGVNAAFLLAVPILSLSTLVPAVLPATFRYLRHKPQTQFQQRPPVYSAPQYHPFQ